MDYGEMIRALSALAAPRFNMSTNSGGPMGGLQGGVDVPLSNNSQAYVGGRVNPMNPNDPMRMPDYGVTFGYRRQF